MKKILLPFILVLLLLLPSFCFADTQPFKDVDGHWADKEIQLAYKNGIMQGVSTDLFNPEGKLTRAELAVCLDRIFDFNFDNLRFIKAPSPADYFDDVEENQYYSQSVMELGFFNVFDIQDRKFKPDEEVTRIEVAQTIAKCFEVKNLNIVTIQMWPQFNDIETTPDLAFIHNTGIMKGRGEGGFAPKAKITRAEFAAVLNRTMSTIKLALPNENEVSEPTVQIDIRGEVKSVVKDGDKISSIYVEGVLTEDTRYDKATIRITDDTAIATCVKGADLPVQDIHQGSIVEVTFTGPVAESYPVQATAKLLRIIE